MADTDKPGGAPAAPSDDRFGRAIDSVLVALSAAVLFVLMLLTVVDVLGRYLFNAPLPGGYEVTEIMMAALVFAALPAVTRREDHIVIDLLDFVVPRGAVRPRQVIVNLLCASVTGVWAWRTWTLGDRLLGYGDVTEYLHIPIAPICYFIAVMSGLTTVVFLYLVWRHATGRARIKSAMSLS
jgi:TRAP-type C4-dicarboxylate transport system permease small subunit